MTTANEIYRLCAEAMHSSHGKVASTQMYRDYRRLLCKSRGGILVKCSIEFRFEEYRLPDNSIVFVML